MDLLQRVAGRILSRLNPQVALSLSLAYLSHTGQQRKRIYPKTGLRLLYFSHPVEVALVLWYLGIRSEEMICAALIHDTLEDNLDYVYTFFGVPAEQRASLEEISRSENVICQFIDRSVGEMVFDMTKVYTGRPGYKDWEIASKDRWYRIWVSDLLRSNHWQSATIKIADMCVNYLDREWTRKSDHPRGVPLKAERRYKGFLQAVANGKIVVDECPPDIWRRVKQLAKVAIDSDGQDGLTVSVLRQIAKV